MRRFMVSLIAMLMLAGAAAALAAAPKKAGVYSGTRPGVVQKQIILRVAKNGKSAYASLRCAGTLASTIGRVAIHNGTFSGTRQTGSVVIWTLKGRFTSRTKAVAHAFLHAVCDGSNVNLSLTLLP